jgi:hypothetical protein
VSGVRCKQPGGSRPNLRRRQEDEVTASWAIFSTRAQRDVSITNKAHVAADLYEDMSHIVYDFRLSHASET